MKRDQHGARGLLEVRWTGRIVGVSRDQKGHIPEVLKSFVWYVQFCHYIEGIQNLLKGFCIVLFERQRKRQARISHLLLDSPYVHKSQAEVRSQKLDTGPSHG